LQQLPAAVPGHRPPPAPIHHLGGLITHFAMEWLVQAIAQLMGDWCVSVSKQPNLFST
jgi:hypothetical protein